MNTFTFFHFFLIELKSHVSKFKLGVISNVGTTFKVVFIVTCKVCNFAWGSIQSLHYSTVQLNMINKLSTSHIVNTNLAGFIPLCHIIPFYLLNWPISYNSIKLCKIISYVIEGYPE